MNSVLVHPPSQRRREPSVTLDHVTRSRPSSNDGRGPLGRTTASDASVRRDVAAQRPALSKIACLATFPLYSMGGRGPDPSRSEKGQAEPTRPGRVVRWAARLRRTLAFGAVGLPTGGGDRQIADASAANPRYDLFVSARSSLRICVICVICGQFACAGV